MNRIAIHTQQLTRRYGDKVAVDQLTLVIPKAKALAYWATTGPVKRPRSAC